MRTDSIKDFELKVKKLKIMKEQNILSEEEYNQIKEKLLNQTKVNIIN